LVEEVVAAQWKCIRKLMEIEKIEGLIPRPGKLKKIFCSKIEELLLLRE
jgi:hypothetical protein